MACKIKSMPQDIQKDILNIKNYTNIINDIDSEEGLYSYYIRDYENIIKYKEEDTLTGKIENKKIILQEKLICTYSAKRAKKDRIDRERGLEKANKIIMDNLKSSITSTRSFKKYIFKTTKDDNCKNFTMGLDWVKIKNDKRYDGFYAITTSRKDLSAIEVIENYHNLYRIEDSFKVLKSTFDTRPIYHYKESRIEAHFIVCFIAFMIERDLEIRLKKSKSFKKYTITPDNIKEALNALEISKVKIDNRVLYMKSNHTNEKDKLRLGRDIHKFLHIKQLKNLTQESELIELLQ